MPVLLLSGVAACQSAGSRHEQLALGNPLDQVAATVWLAEAGDPEAVHTLVNLLQARDSTVRMYAILALERLSGQDYGYKYYEPEPDRIRAVQRWRDALRNGEVTVRRPQPKPGADASEGKPDVGAAAATHAQDRQPGGPRLRS